MAAQRFQIAARRGFEWQRHCESTSMLYQLLLSLKVPPPYKVRHMPAPIFQGAQVVARVALVMTSEKPDLFCNPVFTPWLSPGILCHLDNEEDEEKRDLGTCRNPDTVASTEEDDGAAVKLRPPKLLFGMPAGMGEGIREQISLFTFEFPAEEVRQI